MASSAVAGAATLALGTGVATFFSPCAYALLPGYVGYYVTAADDEDDEDVALTGAMARGLAAFLGVVFVFAALSVVVVLLGQSVEPVLNAAEPLVGVALMALGGVVLLGYTPDWHATLPKRRTSVLGFVLFGAGYAVAAAGCVAPLFLAIVLRAVTFPPSGALVVLAAYTLGFGTLLVAATVAIAVGRKGLVDRLGKRRTLLNTAAGAALVLAGLGQLAVVL